MLQVHIKNKVNIADGSTNMDVFSAILFRNTHLNCCVKHPQYVDA